MIQIKKLLVSVSLISLIFPKNLIFSLKPRKVQSTAFEEIAAGKKLVSDWLETFLVVSESKCALACSMNIFCRSFNFCGPETCELNSQDLYSTNQTNTLFSDVPNCKYYGMKKEALPICKENDRFSDIQEERSNGVCNIKNKRVDVDWSSWTSRTETDTSTELKIVEFRSITLGPAHGGKTNQNDTDTIVITWLISVKEQKNWHSARDHCSAIGGQLFSKVDGTVEQLQFLRERMENQPFWMGIYSEDLVSWK